MRKRDRITRYINLPPLRGMFVSPYLSKNWGSMLKTLEVSLALTEDDGGVFGQKKVATSEK